MHTAGAQLVGVWVRGKGKRKEAGKDPRTEALLPFRSHHSIKPYLSTLSVPYIMNVMILG